MPEEELNQRLEVFRRSGQPECADEVEATYAKGGEPGMIRWYIQRGLPKADRAMSKGGGSNRAWNLAILYSRLDETNEAFHWLENAVRSRDGWVIFIKVHPWLDILRSDPRYTAILRTMNLAD